MVEVAGRIADTFAERVRTLEETMLSPLAVRSYETRGRERHLAAGAEDDSGALLGQPSRDPPTAAAA